VGWRRSQKGNTHVDAGRLNAGTENKKKGGQEGKLQRDGEIKRKHKLIQKGRNQKNEKERRPRKKNTHPNPA
jgi:hypothetical protein